MMGRGRGEGRRGGRGEGRRGGRASVPRSSSSAAHGRAPPPPSPYFHHRDSDASLCSSRPSSAGTGAGGRHALLTDKASQAAALRSVNAYLASISAPVALKPLPPARDITDTLRLLLARLHFPVSDLDSDLPLLLRSLSCPLKLNKSALKAPGTPHNWPFLLSVLHWLSQLAAYSDHAASEPPPQPPTSVLSYVLDSYDLFLRADDDAVAQLDEDYQQKTLQQAESTSAAIAALQQERVNLEHTLHSLQSGPSLKQKLEAERGLLIEDVKKFEKVVETWGGKVAAMEARIAEREGELERKVDEVGRVRNDNVELKRRVDAQGVSARDVERMRREMQAVERDVAEAECERNAAEDKAWELEADVGRKFKEVEAMVGQCNQAIRKLKLGKDFQYVANIKGSSPAEVMGINYKATLKPALSTLVDDTNKASVSNLDELMVLQNKSLEVAAVLEDKRKCLANLHAKNEEAEGRLSFLKKETEDYASKFAAEAGKAEEEFTRKKQELDMLEKEARDFEKDCEQKLHETVRENDEQVQMCARELLAVIDAVSEYKEYMELTIRGMKNDLTETAQFVADAYKASISAKLVSSAPNLHGALKRARH